MIMRVMNTEIPINQHRSDMVVQETVENIYEQQFVDVGL